MTCQRCGCTDNRACLHPSGFTCWWSAPGLCSFCMLADYIDLQVYEAIELRPVDVVAVRGSLL